MMIDKLPTRSSQEGWDEKVEEKTYRGEVPMSPYMTPIDWKLNHIKTKPLYFCTEAQYG